MNIIGHLKRFWRFHSLVLGAVSISALTLGCAMHEPSYYEGTWVLTAAHPPVETTQHTTQPNVSAQFDIGAHAGGNIINKISDVQAKKPKYGPSRSLRFINNGGAADVEISTVHGRIVLDQK